MIATGVSSPTGAPILIETGTAPAAVDVSAVKNAPLTVYVKGGNIWLWGAAPSPKQLTRSGQDSSPKISDDARFVAFRRKSELWVVDVKGNERLLVSSAALSRLLPDVAGKLVYPRQFIFAPRQHVVYFNATIFTDTSPVFLENLISVNVDTAEIRLLLDAGQGGGQMVFSPDGKKIALPRSDKINVVNVDGSNLKTVFTFPPQTLGDANYLPEIVWLPNGSGFKTVIPAPERSRFMFISADGVIVAKLAEFAAVNQPFISPDGARVLYTKTQGTNLELHIIDAGTADQVYFSHAADYFGILGWTPDSAHVFYWRDDRRRLWLGPQEGGSELSDVTFADSLRWVDARRYLFVNDGQLRFRVLGQPSALVDDGLSESDFDFTTLH